MSNSLKDKLNTLIPKLRNERQAILKNHGDKVISQVSVAQAFGGMRGIKAMICDTSVVNADTGLVIRGIPIRKLTDHLPEEIFWLLVTGSLPTAPELKSFQKDLRDNAEVPEYVWKVLRAMPKKSHPMAMLTTAILVMQKDSAFHARYAQGMAKTDYWVPALEDAMRIMGTIHTIAAGIYRIRYKKGAVILPSSRLDWSANYARMLDLPAKKGLAAKMLRLYLVIHSDHEGGNVSANTCHTVASALSDPFYSVSAGLSGLAGPLHGLANQECLQWVLETVNRFGGAPTEKQLEEYTWETLNNGQVIPGYGHAVLRVTDPRFDALRVFGLKHMKNDPVFRTVDRIFRVVPKILKKHGKAKDPWPNVDAGSGAILYHFGLKEFEYYTVLFSVSRCMGMLAQLILNRALGSPLTRPKSVSTAWIKKEVAS